MREQLSFTRKGALVSAGLGKQVEDGNTTDYQANPNESPGV